MFRFLYDYTYECDIREICVFYFVYQLANLHLLLDLAFVLYFVAVFIFSIYDHSIHVTFCKCGKIILLSPGIFPVIFNIILTVAIVAKKRIKINTKYLLSFCFFVFIFYIASCIPAILSIWYAVIPPTLLMFAEDNSLEKQVKLLEKENLERMFILEKALLLEQSHRLLNEELKKNDNKGDRF